MTYIRTKLRFVLLVSKSTFVVAIRGLRGKLSKVHINLLSSSLCIMAVVAACDF